MKYYNQTFAMVGDKGWIPLGLSSTSPLRGGSINLRLLRRPGTTVKILKRLSPCKKKKQQQQWQQQQWQQQQQQYQQYQQQQQQFNSYTSSITFPYLFGFSQQQQQQQYQYYLVLVLLVVVVVKGGAGGLASHIK